MPGANAPNLHIGSRSEMLADYFFGTFGPVTPVRGHDDFGLDLYCALSERIGQRWLPREYFSVQVKSTHDPWDFTDEDEIRWLVEHGNPVLLCVVDKKGGVVEVFHTFGRFAVPRDRLPVRLALRPGTGEHGKFCAWDASGEIDLSAPIIRASITEFYDEAKHKQFRGVLAGWLAHERLNLDYRRMGVTQYKMPTEYSTNDPVTPSIQGTGWYPPNAGDVYNGIARLAEAADCIGNQLRYLRDMKGAVRAALLVDHLHAMYPLAGDSFWRMRVQGHLLPDVAQRLRIDGDGKLSLQKVLEAVQQELDDLPRVATAIARARTTTDPFSFAPRKPDSVP